MNRSNASWDLLGPMRPGYKTVLTPEALGFVAGLAREFTPRVQRILGQRREAQARLRAGESLHFLPETEHIRNDDWTVAPLPGDLLDRRVEITGPVDRKMVINALNSGASCFMADFEDACSPRWDNLILGQENLCAAVAGTIAYEDPKSGKQYELGDDTATLLVRPRGWHLPEKHLLVDGQPVPGGIFDFGLYFFHNVRRLLEKGTGPYFYLPKMEHHQEAKLWNEVFVQAQELMGIPQGTIKATVLIETLPAAFQMDEILYELREHSSGLNCGRWDYIFSFIKTFRDDPSHVMPDRGEVTMTQPCMRAYTQLLIKTCHRREVHAMGGMAAQIPIKGDPVANTQAIEKVRADKLREVQDGHDGTWVAHPALVPVAREVFDTHMPEPSQIDRKREDVNVVAADLLEPPRGNRTDGELRHNVRVGIQYIEAWLGGSGAVPLYNLMEDAATAEISRTQIWQWVHTASTVGDEVLTDMRVRGVIHEELHRIREEIGDERFYSGHFSDAKEIFEKLCLQKSLEEFLTLPAYERLAEV